MIISTCVSSLVYGRQVCASHPWSSRVFFTSSRSWGPGQAWPGSPDPSVHHILSTRTAAAQCLWQHLVLFAFGVFPGGLDGKASACNAGDPGSVPGSGRSPGEGNGNPLQHSCLENPWGQRSLVGYSSLGHEESDTTERVHFHVIYKHIYI